MNYEKVDKDQTINQNNGKINEKIKQTMERQKGRKTDNWTKDKQKNMHKKLMSEK